MGGHDNWNHKRNSNGQQDDVSTTKFLHFSPAETTELICLVDNIPKDFNRDKPYLGFKSSTLKT